MLHACADDVARRVLRFVFNAAAAGESYRNARPTGRSRGARGHFVEIDLDARARFETSAPVTPTPITARRVHSGAHERSPGASHFDRAALLEHRRRNRVEEARLTRAEQLAVAPAFFGVRQVELLARARDPDVKQAPLFLEQRRIVVRLGEREQSVLETSDEDHGELEAFGVVQRHQGHSVGIGAEGVAVGDEAGSLEKMIEWTKADLAQFVGHGFGGTGDQLADVVQPLGRLGAFGTQIVPVTNGFDDLAQQFVDRRLRRVLAQRGDEADEFTERDARRRAKRRDDRRIVCRFEQRDAGVARPFGE